MTRSPSGQLLGRAFGFAFRSVLRQPIRSALAILGVAAVGALLFDMLLLSRGLVLSFRDLLDRAGYDVRVLASDLPPLAGPPLQEATALASAIRSLDSVEGVLQIRLRRADIADGSPDGAPARVEFVGADPAADALWTIVEGQDLSRAGETAAPLVINRNVARRTGAGVGASLALRSRCPGAETLPPMAFRVVGVAEFPFDAPAALTVGGTLRDVERLCPQGRSDTAELLLVRSAPAAGAAGAAAAVRALRPELHVITNEELIERFSRVEFSYFRQISFVLTVVTLFFGFLLIAVLLTVSVNQRLGEVAALRAIGLSRRRVAAGIFLESLLLVAAGGIAALPLGIALSVWLESILHRMPGIPAGVSFFVFEPRALLLHAALLGAAAIGAAVYPMRIVARLPIAATLRREVVS